MPDPQRNLPPKHTKAPHAWTIVWIAAWVGLFVATHSPHTGPKGLPPHSDKVMHLCAYFVLALLGTRSSLARQVELTGGWLIKWVIIYAVYGAADELLQGLVHRSPSVMDWGADLTGATAALAMAYLNRPMGPDPEGA
ncbi:MAG: hypothetical protein GY842_02165 [bacterium]|nr:hypothetical protein [bacterium]